VHPGSGHRDSFSDRTVRIAHRPDRRGWPNSSLSAGNRIRWPNPYRHAEPGQPTAVGRQCAASRPGAGAERPARPDIPPTPTGVRHRIGGSARGYFDAEHAGDWPAVAGRPPSSPAGHAGPARFLCFYDGSAGRSVGAARVTARLSRGRASGLPLGFGSLRGRLGDCGYPTTLTHSCAQGRSACLKARQPAYSMHGGGAGCGAGRGAHQAAWTCYWQIRHHSTAPLAVGARRCSPRGGDRHRPRSAVHAQPDGLPDLRH